MNVVVSSSSGIPSSSDSLSPSRVSTTLTSHSVPSMIRLLPSMTDATHVAAPSPPSVYWMPLLATST